MNIKQKYCGYIIIIGKANVGKSTLLNQMIGKKISIVSRKKNTTRDYITGIQTEDRYQFIYTDTPGVVFNKKNNEIVYKNNHFYHIITNATLIFFVIDQVDWTENDQSIFDTIKKNRKKILIIINKIDKISNKNILLPFIASLKKKLGPIEIFPISSKKSKHILLLKNVIKPYLKNKYHVYPKNYITNNSQVFTISEIIREQLILFLGDELPSIIKVEIELLQHTKKNELNIKGIIFIENNSQKKIVIGKNGSKIKRISMISRYNIEKEFHIKSHLFLWVKKYISK